MAEVDFDEPVPGSPALRAWAHRFASDIRAGVASHQRSTSVARRLMSAAIPTLAPPRLFCAGRASAVVSRIRVGRRCPPA